MAKCVGFLPLSGTSGTSATNCLNLFNLNSNVLYLRNNEAHSGGSSCNGLGAFVVCDTSTGSVHKTTAGWVLHSRANEYELRNRNKGKSVYMTELLNRWLYYPWLKESNLDHLIHEDDISKIDGLSVVKCVNEDKEFLTVKNKEGLFKARKEGVKQILPIRNLFGMMLFTKKTNPTYSEL